MTKQLHLGKEEEVFEDTCFFCQEELIDPTYFVIYRYAQDDEEVAVCGDHSGWKFRWLCNFMEPGLLFLLVFGVPLFLGVEVVRSCRSALSRMRCYVR